MPRRADAYRGLAQASRLRVLDAILATPGLGLAELSERTGLHQNTLRDHVRMLEAEGFIEPAAEHRGTRGRPRTVFRPVRGDEPNEVAERRVQEAIRHGDLMRRVMPSEQVLDGAALHQIDALYEHLDDVGLEPEIDEDQLVVDLNPCPFDTLVDDNREIVCHVHAELIRDVLVRAGGPVELDHVLPYRTAHSCRVQLMLRAPSPEAPTD